MGYGFLGLYSIPMNGATLMAGRGRFAWVATVGSAGLNIALLFVFVPNYGIKAAAIASAVGYLVLLVTISIYAHARPNPIRYRWTSDITDDRGGRWHLRACGDDRPIESRSWSSRGVCVARRASDRSRLSARPTLAELATSESRSLGAPTTIRAPACAAKISATTAPPWSSWSDD